MNFSSSHDMMTTLSCISMFPVGPSALQEEQQQCTALQETKALLEEQLADARGRCSSLRELERDNLLLRHRVIDAEAVGLI